VRRRVGEWASRRSHMYSRAVTKTSARAAIATRLYCMKRTDLNNVYSYMTPAATLRDFAACGPPVHVLISMRERRASRGRRR
jgi:hypothetical protein